MNTHAGGTSGKSPEYETEGSKRSLKAPILAQSEL